MGLLVAVEVHAQCCGAATTTFYQPTTQTVFLPVVQQTQYTGWYPGYWLDRIRTRLWGSPTTFVAAYPTTIVTSTPTFTTSAYSPAPVVSYAAPTCPSCPVQTVSYAPSACASCDPCAASASSSVVQAVYESPAGCPSCSPSVSTQGATVVSPGTTSTQSSGATQPRTFEGQTPTPTLDPSVTVPDRTPQSTQRPETIESTPNALQPAPANDTGEKDPYKVDGQNSTYFQAPQLFDPQDRAASRTPRQVIRPVTTAIYEKPVSYRDVSLRSYRPISREQAERDAAGWVAFPR